MKKKQLVILEETVGWLGAGAIILAYGLVSTAVISATSWEYQLLNLLGAGGILAVAIEKHVTQSIVLNVFWAGISLFALFSILGS